MDADAAWSCDGSSATLSATSCVAVESFISVTLCIALLQVLSGPILTAARATGTTKGDGFAGVA
jgi:hypothetical protein